MGVTYYKRYRLEVELRRDWCRPGLPVGFRWVAWSSGRASDLVARHAEAQFYAFRDELDASVFPTLGDAAGCRRLVEEIASKPGFLPEATWLVEAVTPSGVTEPVGAVQGVRVTPRYGAVQNVGVTPWGRGRGLGRALVQAALAGFHDAGLTRATLEVTATNGAALAMYASLGFVRVKTTYRAVETAYA